MTYVAGVTTAATVTTDEIRARLRGRVRAVDEPEWLNDDGKKTVLLELIMPTPVAPEVTAASVAERLRNDAEVAANRAAAIEWLAEMGWKFAAPTAREDQGFLDISVKMRKRFATPDEAMDEVRQCGAIGEGWNFGWNERDDVEFWEDIY